MYCHSAAAHLAPHLFSCGTSAINDGHAGPSHAGCCYIASWELGCLEQSVGCCKSTCVASSRCPERHGYVLTKQWWTGGGGELKAGTSANCCFPICLKFFG